MSGILSIRFVSHWLSFFHDRLTPHSVFFSGSSPIFTFVVSGCSFRNMNVPPTMKSLLTSYCMLKPTSVLRCMP